MKKNTGFGLGIILLAVLTLLSAFGYTSGISVWRLILSFCLVWIFANSIFRLNFFGIFVPIALAIVMYSNELNLDNLNQWAIILGAIFLSLGFSIVFGKKYCKTYYYSEDDDRFKNHHFDYKRNNQNGNDDNVFDADATFSSEANKQCHDKYEDYVKEPIEDDVIRYKNSLTSATRFIKSNNLKYAKFENELGSLNIYLDQIELSETGAQIDVYCRLGNIKLFIPRRFNLKNEVEVTLGSVTAPYLEVSNKDTDNTITLKGNVTLGDINIVRI